MGLAPQAAGTPAGRETAPDPALGGAIAPVVLRHRLMPVVSWDGREVRVGNAQAAPGAARALARSAPEVAGYVLITGRLAGSPGSRRPARA